MALTDAIHRISRSLCWLSVERPAEESFGTAFVVGRGGDLLTCAHLLRDATKVEATLLGTHRPARCAVVATDAAADLALLRIEARDLVPVSLRRGDPVALGREVAFMGFPHSDIFQPPLCMTMRGIVGNRYRLGAAEYYVVDAAASEGMSGGPLFLSETGEVVGVVGGRFDPARTRAKLRGASAAEVRDLPAERTSVMFACAIEHALALVAKRTV